MINKEQFEKSVMDEIRIIKHLATKVLPGTLDYKPTPKQRSLLELMQYLTQSGSTLTEVILTGNMALFQENSEKAKSVNPENFAAAMDEQGEKLKELLSKFDDAQLSEEIDLFNSGFKQTKAENLLNGMLKGLAAYRMQLFLYIKASGREDIGTSNVWMGVDSPPKAE